MSESSPNRTNKPLLSNRSYNVLKTSTMIVLPAIGVLYVALAQIWGLPKAEEVVGSTSAISVFLGSLAKYSTKSYNNSDAKYAGEMKVEDTGDGTKMFSLNLNEQPESLETKDEVIFKVNNDG